MTDQILGVEAGGSGRRILFVVNDVPYFLLHWRHRAEAAERSGFEVHVAIPPHPRTVELPWPIHPLGLVRSGTSFWQDLRTLFALLGIVRTIRPAVIHCATIKPNVYGGVIARALRIPAILSVTGLGSVFAREDARSGWARRVVLILYRIAGRSPRTLFLFENSDDRDLFVSERVAPIERTEVLPGAGVDPETYQPADRSRAESPVVLLAARLLWDKGVGVFVDAAPLIRRDHPGTRMVLVGEPDPGNAGTVDEATLRKWHADGIVEWWGRSDAMPAVLAQATVVCLPTTYREGIPRVLIEAAACGRPIIASSVPGCRDICRHEVNGLLLSAPTAEALAGSVGRLLSDPVTADAFGAMGRRIAVEEYGQDLVVARTLAAYQRAAQGR